MPLFRKKSIVIEVIRPEQFTQHLENVTREMLVDVNAAIKAGLIEIRNYQRDNHRWKHITKTLYHGHKVEQLHTGKWDFGYAIMANPYIDPQIDPETGVRKVVKEDYAYKLENWPKYAWFYQGYQMKYPQLLKKVEKAIQKHL